nr:PREDICTED: lymphocyte antigen 6E-like [Apteryx mantelli mantelli]
MAEWDRCWQIFVQIALQNRPWQCLLNLNNFSQGLADFPLFWKTVCDEAERAGTSPCQLLTEVCLSLAAHTLICFSCSDASSNWACLKPVKCGENENHCVTTYVGVGIGSKSGQSISKGCSPICPSAGINLGIAAASVYCCDSFLCNISGSSNVKASYMVLALGILVSFIYVLRARE